MRSGKGKYVKPGKVYRLEGKGRGGGGGRGGGEGGGGGEEDGQNGKKDNCFDNDCNNYTCEHSLFHSRLNCKKSKI